MPPFIRSFLMRYYFVFSSPWLFATTITAQITMMIWAASNGWWLLILLFGIGGAIDAYRLMRLIKDRAGRS